MSPIYHAVPFPQLTETELKGKFESHLEGSGPDLEPDELDRWYALIQVKIEQHQLAV